MGSQRIIYAEEIVIHSTRPKNPRLAALQLYKLCVRRFGYSSHSTQLARAEMRKVGLEARMSPEEISQREAEAALEDFGRIQ